MASRNTMDSSTSHPNLTHVLDQQLVEWPGSSSNGSFLPITALDFLTLENVAAELRRIFPQASPSWIADRTQAICNKCKKLFAVFLLGQRDLLTCIEKLLREDVTDDDLPFRRQFEDEQTPFSSPTGNFWLCRSSRNEFKERQNDQCVMNTMAEWTAREKKAFLVSQWAVQAPIFRWSESQIFHYEFHTCTIMPFIEDHQGNGTYKNSGGYSEVWPMRIHFAHQEFYGWANKDVSPPFVAVKRPYTSNAMEFQTERSMLNAITIQKHPHLIKLLATYQFQDKYHFLFPWAEKNLRSYWASVVMPFWNPSTYWWALQQMHGLASGLDEIHNYRMEREQERQVEVAPNFQRGQSGRHFNVLKNEAKFGRHGDLKPENILWFKDENGGNLQITDLGLARFHGKDSRSAVPPKSVNGSPTYTPPEIMLNKFVSRAYDIWSLGAVFLEFVTWLVDGSEGIGKFADQRLATENDEIEDDTFFSLKKSAVDGAVVRPGVTLWVQRLRSESRCSPMLHDILNIIESHMLVISATERIPSSDLKLKLGEVLKKAAKTEYLVGAEAPASVRN